MQTQPKGNEFFPVLWWRAKLYSKRMYRWLERRNPEVDGVWPTLLLVWLECMLILGVAGLTFYVLSLWLEPLCATLVRMF